MWQPGTTEIVYTLQTQTETAAQTKTLLIPANVAEYEPEEVEVQIVCGDGICHPSENCDEDCSPKRPWGWILLFVILGAGSIYYVNFYKGPFALHFIHPEP